MKRDPWDTSEPNLPYPRLQYGRWPICRAEAVKILKQNGLEATLPRPGREVRVVIDRYGMWLRNAEHRDERDIAPFVLHSPRKVLTDG